LAQDPSPTIIKVAGKAEIIERGRRLPIREGQRLLAGQSIELIGGGEVRLTTVDGKIKIRIVGGTTVRYDGLVEANSQPWAAGPTYQTAGQGDSTPQFRPTKGKLEVEVAPGQRLRILCPLILAAVRGTFFTVTVEADGSSRVDGFDGQLAFYGRQGEMGLIRPGQNVQIRANDYSAFLAKKGVEVPDADWRKVSAKDQKSVDNQTLGPIFSPNSDLLVAVLSNSDASPTAGLEALALERSADESGSIFAAELTDNAVDDASRIMPAASEIVPQSPVLDVGLRDMQPLSIRIPLGHVTGEFTLPGFIHPFAGYTELVVANKFNFDLDFNTGQISNALFDISYAIGFYAFSYGYNELSGNSGTGAVDLNSLQFSISNFNSANSHYSEGIVPSSTGHVGPGTVMAGSLAPLNLGSASGVLALDYVTTNAIAQTVMPTSLNFAGLIKDKPYYEVNGSFNLPASANNISQNYFKFDLYADGQIKDGRVSVGYEDSTYSNTPVYFDFFNGTGSILSSNFNVNLPNGMLYYKVGMVNTVSYSVSGVLQGSMSSSDPVVGDQVIGGSFTGDFTLAGPPVWVPTTLSINDGDVVEAGAGDRIPKPLY
jgi:hypothetical protein